MKNTIFLLSLCCISINIRCNSYIHVIKQGTGAPVLIISGLGGTEVWQNLFQKLSEANTCYLISIRGLNGDKNADEPDFIKIREEIIGYVQQEHLSNPVLIGHSFGGILALQLACDYPAFFRSLILVDSYPFSPAISNPAFTGESGQQQSTLFRNQLTGLPENTYRFLWSQNVRQFTTDTAFQRVILEKILNSERKYIAGIQTYALSNDLRPSVQNIHCPVMALCSLQTFGQASIGEDILEQRISSQFTNINDCKVFINRQTKHFIMLDAADWSLEHIQQAISGK